MLLFEIIKMLDQGGGSDVGTYRQLRRRTPLLL
jgi:hypothetical protein